LRIVLGTDQEFNCCYLITSLEYDNIIGLMELDTERRVIDSDFDHYAKFSGPLTFLRPLDIAAERVTHGKVSTARLLANRVSQRGSRGVLRKAQSVWPRTFPFAFGSGAGVLHDITDRYEQAEGDEKTGFKMVLDNMLVFGNFVFESASQHYKSMWFRDAWFTAMFTGSDVFKRKLVQEFGNWSRKGQPPTEVYLLPHPMHFFQPHIRESRDDETALQWMITALEVGGTTTKKMAETQGFIDSHVEDGRYMTPAGTRRSMIDALSFPRKSVLGYNTGLYAYEAQGAAAAGFTTQEKADKAAQAYKELAEVTGNQYIPLSDSLPWFDPTAYLGEYLSLVDPKRGRSLLGTDLIRNSLDFVNKHHLRERGLGLVTEDGEKAPSELFLDDYQTKPWAMWWHIFDAVCEMHGLNDGSYRQATRDQLNRSNWAEHEDAKPEKWWHVWNAYTLRQQREVSDFLARGRLKSAAN
jgi:hypothetical protein